MKPKNVSLFVGGQKVGELKSFKMQETDGALSAEAIRKAFEQASPVTWRGYRGFLVEIEETPRRDGTWVITKLEGTFLSPVSGEAVTVPIPPDEVRLAP